MAGWSHQKRVAFEQAFYAYLDNCEINSGVDAQLPRGYKVPTIVERRVKARRGMVRFG